MNLTIFFEKDDFDEDAFFLKIESDDSFNKVVVEVVFNNQRWFYDHMEMSANYAMTKEVINFKESMPYEIESALKNDPEDGKPHVLNLNVILFEDDVVIANRLSQLYLKKSWENTLEATDIHFEQEPTIESADHFNNENNVNVTILSEIHDISDPNLLKDVKELEIELTSSDDITEVEVKVDMFSDYNSIVELTELVSIAKETTSKIRLNENLFQLLDDNVSYEIRKKKQLVLNTEVTYTEVATQKKCSRIQSHFIRNPWCIIMEKKVEKHITILKNVLNEEFPSWSGEVKDNEMWTSFRINDDEFQYGLKRGRIYLHLYLGEISYDHDFEEVFAEMQKINETLDKEFTLIETDNYFNIKSQITSSKLKKDILTEHIKKMIAITELPKIVGLRDTYEEY